MMQSAQVVEQQAVHVVVDDDFGIFLLEEPGDSDKIERSERERFGMDPEYFSILNIDKNVITGFFKGGGEQGFQSVIVLNRYCYPDLPRCRHFKKDGKIFEVFTGFGNFFVEDIEIIADIFCFHHRIYFQKSLTKNVGSRAAHANIFYTPDNPRFCDDNFFYFFNKFLVVKIVQQEEKGLFSALDSDFQNQHGKNHADNSLQVGNFKIACGNTRNHGNLGNQIGAFFFPAIDERKGVNFFSGLYQRKRQVKGDGDGDRNLSDRQ
ncbi:MAG: hypothetical protein U0519_00635 [Candidatus Gracilibacteria bacterium]